MHCAQPFQLFKPLLWGLAQRLNRVSVFLMGLTLHAGEEYAFHLRFALHNPRSIGNLDAESAECHRRRECGSAVVPRAGASPSFDGQRSSLHHRRSGPDRAASLSLRVVHDDKTLGLEFPCGDGLHTLLCVHGFNTVVRWFSSWAFAVQILKVLCSGFMYDAKYAIVSYILPMWIPRDVEARLRRSAKTRPVIVLTGARQTGKTSTFRHLFPEYAFVSLDLPTEAEQAEKEPERFLQRHPSPVIIDKVQYAPGLFRHLKVSVDAHRTRNGQFLLTGSQKFALMRNVSESLAGRADIVELETLSFAEIREALPNAELETSIVRGGFPELHANPDIDSVAFYTSYLATYLERDVRALANVGSLRDFERFLRACRPPFCQPAEQSRPRAGCRDRTVDSESMAVHAGNLRPGRVARTVVLESNQVHCQEPQTLHRRYRPALRSAEYSIRGNSSAVARGRRGMGDLRFCPTSGP
jgi:AAA domain